MFARVPWARVWGPEAVAGANAGVLFGYFPLVELNLFATFAVVVTSFTAGTVQASIRFGFTKAQAAAGTEGINFAALGAMDAIDVRNVVYQPAAVAPNVNGSAPGILPPNWAVFVTSPVGTDLEFEIHATCVSP